MRVKLATDISYRYENRKRPFGGLLYLLIAFAKFGFDE
jgi:hypothetical protein